METKVAQQVLRAYFRITRPESVTVVRYTHNERPLVEIELIEGDENACIETLDELCDFGPGKLGHNYIRGNIHSFFCEEWTSEDIKRYESLVNTESTIVREYWYAPADNTVEYKLEPGDRQFLTNLGIVPE